MKQPKYADGTLAEAGDVIQWSGGTHYVVVKAHTGSRWDLLCVHNEYMWQLCEYSHDDEFTNKAVKKGRLKGYQ